MISLDQVFGPMTPSAARDRDFWNWITAERVFGPKTPSASSE
nr:hypothetical protein [Streptomyces capitiformicae]